MSVKFPPPSPPFIRARNQGGSQTPKALVLHGTVSSDNPGTARNIALWWNGPTSPMSSAHYVVDPKEVIQCVGDHSVAYHSGYNQDSIGIEFCDEQQGPASRWADADSTAILRRGARLTAELCLAYDIEARRPTVAELKRKGPHGIYGHNDSRLAFGNTVHTDPRDFPWAKFLRMVRAEIEAIRAAASRPKVPTFKVLHAPLHGNSATKNEMRKALNRQGVVSVVFSEAYKHGWFLGRRPRWRAVVGGRRKDRRGRMVERDVIILVRKYRKHLRHGIRKAARASKPLKIAPERFLVWSIDNVHGKPLATIGLHPHAAVLNAWGTPRAREYRRQMKALEYLVTELRMSHGDDLDIVIVGDLNYPDRDDNRWRSPRETFERLGMRWVSRGLDWVAYSEGLRRVDFTVIPTSENGQDHPWLEVEFARR